MIEVKVVLRFNNHSLGNCRFEKISKFLHDPEGRVMFLPTWWETLMRYSATVLNHHQNDIKNIDWDPVIPEAPNEYKRFYSQGRYTLHEAYLPGDTVTVHAVLPTTISVDDFKELLAVAGRYKGISPYRPDKRYGTFDVISVERRHRSRVDPPAI